MFLVENIYLATLFAASLVLSPIFTSGCRNKKNQIFQMKRMLSAINCDKL